MAPLASSRYGPSSLMPRGEKYYSGAPLLWTLRGPGEVPCIERCPHFRGKLIRRKLIWDIAKCQGYPFMSGFAVVPSPGHEAMTPPTRSLHPMNSFRALAMLLEKETVPPYCDKVNVYTPGKCTYCTPLISAMECYKRGDEVQ